MKNLIMALTILFSATLMADDHSMTNIHGTNVELKSYDHAIAGALNGFLIFGNVDEEKGQSVLTIKKDGMITTATFERTATRPFGGVITLGTEVDVQFKKLDRNLNVYTFSINNELVDIKVEASDFVDNHFINPKYSTTIKGKPFTFKIENGGACYNMSAHLIAMLIGAASL